MARLIFTGNVSIDTQTGLFALARSVVASTVFLKITDGGGSGTNTLTITYQGVPNPQDSDAAKVYITDTNPSSFPTTVISSSSLPDSRLLGYQMSGVGRFNLDYAGGGSKIFSVSIWVDP